MSHTSRLLPPPCKPGDRVAIVAPASPFLSERLEHGCALLRSWGLEPVYSEKLFERWGYLAGEDSVRTQLLQEAFGDPSVQAVLCARGGYGTARLAESMPWETIAASGKRFVGFSDVTFLHLAWLQKTPWITFHGPMVASAHMYEGTEASQQRLKQALFATSLEEMFAPLAGTPLASGTATGPLWGGNLSLLVTTLGTPWQPNLEGAILVIEDVSEPPYRLDRMFQHLRQAGVLEAIAGLGIGDVGVLKDQYTTYTSREFWIDRLGLSGFPIVAELPVGHIRNNHTLPLGACVTLDADKGELRLADV